MLKNKVDFKLINLALISFIAYILYKTSDFWLGTVNKIIAVMAPLIIAFILAYVLYPFFRYLQEKKIPKGVSLFIVIAVVIVLLGIILWIIGPLLFSQISSLFSGIMAFLKEISVKFDVDVGALQQSLGTLFSSIITKLGEGVSNEAANFIGTSLGYISTGLISFSIAVYLLLDMETIRKGFKKYVDRKSKKVGRYLAILDDQMHRYLTGYFKIVFITVFEYGITYLIIGHPNALLLGILAAIASIIPYFGGIIANCIAAVTAFVVSPALFVRTVIAFVILSTLDGYVINPLVYGKTNQIHPIITILSVFVGGALFGIAGIVLSLPVAIVIVTTYKYFKEDINYKISDMTSKEKKKIKKDS